MVMDSEPFRDLHYILQDLNDDRIWVFAEWVRRCTTAARFCCKVKPFALTSSNADFYWLDGCSRQASA